MKIIDVSQALGMVLGQDFTRIVPGEFKGVGQLHENEGAEQLARVAVQNNLICTEAAEGKVNVKAHTGTWRSPSLFYFAIIP